MKGSNEKVAGGPTIMNGAASAATPVEENGETEQPDNNDFNLYVPNVLIIVLFLLVE